MSFYWPFWNESDALAPGSACKFSLVTLPIFTTLTNCNINLNDDYGLNKSQTDPNQELQLWNNWAPVNPPHFESARLKIKINLTN